MPARARPKGRPSQIKTEGIWLSVLASVWIVFLVAAPAKINALWGVNFWALWPLTWRIMAAALGLAAIWFHNRIPALPKLRIRTSLLAIVILLALALVWTLLPARTLLFGDSIEVANRIGGETWVTPRSPLYSILVRGLGRIAGPNHPGLLAKAVQGISVLSGLITALLLIRLGKTRYRSMGLVLAGIFMGGYMGLFQSYVEAYAVIVVAMCVYMSVLLAPRSTVQTIGLLLAQAFVIAAHIMGVLFLPVTLWVVLDRFSVRTRILVGVGGLALLAFALVARSRGVAEGLLSWIPPAQFFVRQVGYLVHPPSWSPGFFSVWHPIDILNGYLLSVGAAFILGLAFVVSSAGRQALARALCTPLGAAVSLFFLARCLIITPLGGPALDWDLFAAFGFPLGFLVAEAWYRSGFKSTHAAVGRMLVILAVVFVLPLVAMLGSSTASTRRVLAYGNGSPNPRPVVQAQIAHHLGDQAARTGDENAPRLFSLAFQLDPNPVYARRAGEAWRLAGDKDKALQEFTNAIDRDSVDIVSLAQRGFLWLGKGNAAKAEEDFNAVLRIDPENTRSLYGLGLVAGAEKNPQLERTRMEEVVQRIEEELKERPATSWDWSTLGDCYRSLSQFDAAERAYRKANELRTGKVGEN